MQKWLLMQSGELRALYFMRVKEFHLLSLPKLRLGEEI